MSSKITFGIKQHQELGDVGVVEIIKDGEVCGVIYPDGGNDGIRLISAHFAGAQTLNNEFPEGIKMDTGESHPPLPIPFVSISFCPHRYLISAGRLIRLE